MAKGLPEYSDEELLQMLQEFQALSDEDKATRRLGAGVDKLVYDIPNKDLVLKLPNTERPYNKYGLDTDYLYSKLMNKSIPVETPVLLKQPVGTGIPDALIQRKLRMPDEKTGPDSAFYEELYSKYPNDKIAREEALKLEKQRIKEIPDQKAILNYFKQFDKAGLNDADLHTQNIALDKDNIAKAIDVAPFYYDRIDTADKLNSGLARTRDTFFDKMDNLAKPKIYRSVAPMLLKGAAAGATAGLSLASEAADTEEFGDAPEQSALLRESDEYNRRKKTLAQYPEASQMYDELDQGKAFDARRDALLKLTQK
jgi:hypothetical protein